MMTTRTLLFFVLTTLSFQVFGSSKDCHFQYQPLEVLVQSHNDQELANLLQFAHDHNSLDSVEVIQREVFRRNQNRLRGEVIVSQVSAALQLRVAHIRDAEAVLVPRLVTDMYTRVLICTQTFVRLRSDLRSGGYGAQYAQALQGLLGTILQEDLECLASMVPEANPPIHSSQSRN